MRLTVTMSGRQGTVSLPLHYQHLLQGLLYRSLENEQLAAFLHDRGFRHGKRSFKLFTFSRLFGTHQVNRERKTIHFFGGFPMAYRYRSSRADSTTWAEILGAKGD